MVTTASRYLIANLIRFPSDSIQFVFNAALKTTIRTPLVIVLKQSPLLAPPLLHDSDAESISSRGYPLTAPSP